MSVARRIHFNALPEAVRQRFVERTSGREQPGALCSEPLTGQSVRFGFFALLGLGALVATCAYHFGHVSAPDAIQPPLWLAAYAASGFVLLYSILVLARRWALRKALPYRPGRYLFPLEVVEADSEVLTLWPMSQCTDVQAKHERYNGVDIHTAMIFVFEGGRTHSFGASAQGAKAALQIMATVQSKMPEVIGRVRSGQGTKQDVGFLDAFDLFSEARMSREWDSLSETPPHQPGREAVARPRPGYLQHISALAAAAAVALAVPVWVARNQRSDEAIWTFAQARHGSWALEAYLVNGRAHLDEARPLLMQRKLEEARADGTVTALRRFLDQYPDHAEARQAVHALYERAMTAFAAQASTEDPRLVPFVKALIGSLEASQSTRVDVRFFRPSEALLQDIDKLVSESGVTIEGVQVAQVTPQFSRETAQRRESTILASLQQGFGAVFPEDIMALEYVALPGGTDAQPEIRPTIDVAYIVAPSGSLHAGETRDHDFIGIQIRFGVDMHVPGHPDTISFELTVEPPSELVVEPSYLAFAGAPLGEGGLADDRVYTVMAARAFDHLSQKLRLALFRSDSEAFRRAEKALQVAGAAAGAGAEGAPAEGADGAPAGEAFAPPQ
jgi:hypothetical protein